MRSDTPGLESLLTHLTNNGSCRLVPCSDSLPQTVVRIRWELDPYLPWRAHHRLRLLGVRSEACALEGLDEDVECLLKKLGISRCDVAIIDIKNGEEFLHSNGELAVRVVEHLAHEPQPLTDDRVDEDIK